MMPSDGVFACSSAHRDIEGQEREAEGEGEDQIDQYEQSAPVPGCQIRKAPEIAAADRAACCGHDKAELSCKPVLFMFVIVCCAGIGIQIRVPAFWCACCSFFAFCIIHKKKIYRNLPFFGPDFEYLFFSVCKIKIFIYSGYYGNTCVKVTDCSILTGFVV